MLCLSKPFCSFFVVFFASLNYLLFQNIDNKDNIEVCSGADCKQVADLDAVSRGTIISLEEDIARCPRFLRGGLLWPVYEGVSFCLKAIDCIMYKTIGHEILSPSWADAYSIASYIIPIRFLLGFYTARDKSFVQIPTTMMLNETVQVGYIRAPHVDVDASPNFFWFENYLPKVLFKKLYVPALTCLYGSLRDLVWDDAIDDNTINTWEAVLHSGRYKRKVDWIMAFYRDAKTWDGQSLWAKQMVDFGTLFLKADQWNDGLESSWAFQLIGTHRVEQSERWFKGEELPFVIRLNRFSKLAVRPGFGKLGCDMYFNSDGLPVLIETTEGKQVIRGDKDWQYWKFVWRSSLITIITLVDHLHFTHFRTANIYARLVRMTLPPDDEYRRLFSIFTFGHIFVNMQAMHALIGPRHWLHRATPLEDLESLAQSLNREIVDVTDQPAIKALLYDDDWDRLPQKLKEAPFYADGRLLLSTLRDFAQEFEDIVDICSTFDQDWTKWVNMSMVGMRLFTNAHYPYPTNFKWQSSSYEMFKKFCFGSADDIVLDTVDGKGLSPQRTRQLRLDRFASFMFVVSGWHRHVGFVGDYYADPELAAMSWKEGERYGRPRQHMIQTFINTFTSTTQPKLNEDFSHVFKGLKKESQLVAAWHKLLKNLDHMGKEIDARNDKRAIKNINMHPSVLESAVSK